MVRGVTSGSISSSRSSIVTLSPISSTAIVLKSAISVLVQKKRKFVFYLTMPKVVLSRLMTHGPATFIHGDVAFCVNETDRVVTKFCVRKVWSVGAR